MLKISEQAHRALAAKARPAYAERLRLQLSEDYPHFLPRFPDDVARRIVANMLERASAWGLTEQRAFTIWCGWMIVIAPNFDEESEINQALRGFPAPIDRALPSLVNRVSKDAWSRADSCSSVLPLFVSPSLSRSPLSEQILAALPLVLFGLPQADDPVPIARQAIADAVAMGLGDIADAPLVIACCLALWGSGWVQLPWAEDLRRERIVHAELLAALRFRLALEFGRYV